MRANICIYIYMRSVYPIDYLELCTDFDFFVDQW